MKKCIICGEEAEYCIKDSSECYCKECSEESFGDLSYLQKIEEDAIRLKQYLKEKMRDEV